MLSTCRPERTVDTTFVGQKLCSNLQGGNDTNLQVGVCNELCTNSILPLIIYNVRRVLVDRHICHFSQEKVHQKVHKFTKFCFATLCFVWHTWLFVGVLVCILVFFVLVFCFGVLFGFLVFFL